ncbi:hypothetical protein KEJ19_07960 [Candidatus Bathyarchaeota archaeon]|nr:hypothetical protein [Candidatus Bathyarchaeota archaeon]
MATKAFPSTPVGRRGRYVIVAILLATLLIGSAITLFPLEVFAIKDEAKRAEDLIKIAQKAESRVQALIDVVKSNNTIIEKIIDIGLNESFYGNITVFEEGSELLDKAEAAFSAESYGEAMQNATLAMEKFRDAFRGICTILQEAGFEEIEVEGRLIILGEAEGRPEYQAQGLLVAMNRCLERIEVLNNTLKSLSKDDIEEIQEVLYNAYLCLNISKAKELLSEPGHVAEVAHNLTLANRLMNQAHLMVKAMASAKCEERMERFMLRIEERIRRMIGNLSKTDLDEMAGLMGFRNIGEFQKALRGFLEEARERYKMGKIGEALGRLKLVERRIGEFTRLFEARQLPESEQEEGHLSLEVSVTKEVQKNFVTLKITVKNTGDVSIVFPNAAFGLIIEKKVANGNGGQDVWKPFYTPVSAQVLVTLDPREAREIAIKIQKPPEGIYRAVAHGWSKVSMEPVVAYSEEFSLP